MNSVCLILLSFLTTDAIAADIPDDIPSLQQSSVVVHCGDKIGSGTVVSHGDHSYVWTAQHVVDEDDEEITVTNEDESYNAVLIGADAFYDIAVLLLDVRLTYGVEWSFDEVKIGAPLTHIGCPFGIREDSLSTGYLSNDRGRKMQATFTVYSGCSGGAVFTSDGKQVGIVVSRMVERNMIPCPTISYYVPAHIVLRFCEENDLLETVGR